MNEEDKEKLKEALRAGFIKIESLLDISDCIFVDEDEDSEKDRIATESALKIVAMAQPRLDLLKEKLKKRGFSENSLQHAIELCRGRGYLTRSDIMEAKKAINQRDIDYAEASKTDLGIFNLFEDYDSISTELASKRLKKTKRAIINSTSKLTRKGVLITNSESESKYSPYRRYKLNPDKSLEELKILLLTPEKNKEEK